jgi:hypothetical protein
MFKLAQSPEFWARVTFDLQTDDGKRVPGAFDLRFKRMSVTALRELSEQQRDSGADDRAFLREIVTDWRGVADEDGSEVPFTKDGLDGLFERGLSPAILAAFYRALPKAKEKN